MPYLMSIHVFPIKSLDGISVPECDVLPSGALKHDRSLALTDVDGNIVNAKRHVAIHRLRTEFDLAGNTVLLSESGRSPVQFHLHKQRHELSEWFSEFFGFAVTIQQDLEHGFPDDLDSPGPTLISTATLQSVAKWFPSLSVTEVSRRFRANLEIDVTEPFWEDRLFGAASPIRFRLGEVEFWGTNPCQRCAVPSRSPDTGDTIESFARIFSEQREKSLPHWSPVARFDHFYRLAVNTRLAQTGGGQLRVGDQIRIIG